MPHAEIGSNRSVRVLLVGLCTVDLVHRVGALPQPGDKLQSSALEVVAGGPATNAAVAVAGLGGTAELLTILGAHPLANLARADLAECGVRVHDVLPLRAEPPPLSTVMVRETDGERVVVSHNAAGMPVDLPMPTWSRLLSGVGAVLVDGHHPRLAVAAANAARSRNIPVILDAGSDKPVLDELLPLVDVCACAAAFRRGGFGMRETEIAVHRLGVPVVIRTDGAAEVRWSTTASDSVLTGFIQPAAVLAKDTLGAGDVWHGALAHGVAELARTPTAHDLPQLIAEANRVAGRRIALAGARTWLRS